MKQKLAGVWRAWKELAGYIGDFQARLLLTLFYFTVAAPFALLTHLADPLSLRRSRTSAWIRRPSPDVGLPAARRQF